MTFLRLTPAMATHRGMRRRQNEDAVGYDYPVDPDVLRSHGALFIVADGVGGLSGGDRASRMAVDQLVTHYYASSKDQSPQERLAQAFQKVNTDIFRAMNRQAATTLVAVVVIDDQLIAASVGDSLIFRIRNDQIEQLNDVDVLDSDDADNGALTKAIGYREELEVDTISDEVQVGDSFLLCSDGLTRYLQDDQLVRHAHLRDPRDGVRRMINEANAAGGADNISTVLIHVGDRLPIDDMQEHRKRISVLVAVDTDPMIKLDVPTKPNTQIPLSRPEPALPQDVLKVAEDSVKKPAPAQPKPIASPPSTAAHKSDDGGSMGLLVAGGVVIVLGVIILIAALMLMNNTATVPIATIAPETSLTETPAPTAEERPRTTDTIRTPDDLQVGDVIMLETTVLTLARFDDANVAAFPASQNTPYRVDEIIEDSEGRLWYRLQEEETGQRGWVSNSDLPEYRLQSPASD